MLVRDLRGSVGQVSALLFELSIWSKQPRPPNTVATFPGDANGQQIQFINILKPIHGTNVVPRDSIGAELQVILPIVNAPFRIYYAFNLARLYEDVQGESLITRSMFPAGGAGDFTYNEAISAYDSLLHFREPRKTFRLSVSTTF